MGAGLSIHPLLGPDPHSGSSPALGWSYLHKPIIVLVMGSLMSAAGGLLLLLQSTGVTEGPRSVASACVTIGLMFVVMGLVWIPVLKEKQRRKGVMFGVMGLVWIPIPEKKQRRKWFKPPG
ncbi:unnamed protein product [Pleuronectes platessa]|uniref:Uncharacterized protein n=1 Tax=Pleuronectes platessa TaxID=8262 RepID=A0A9N7USD8_PLEPL|nr:unnamed protein product [Pleuronectes platessa]